MDDRNSMNLATRMNDEARSEHVIVKKWTELMIAHAAIVVAAFSSPLVKASVLRPMSKPVERLYTEFPLEGRDIFERAEKTFAK